QGVAHAIRKRLHSSSEGRAGGRSAPPSGPSTRSGVGGPAQESGASVVLNIAEARGSDAGNARARFATACGSAKEVRAALHIASDWGYIGSQTATHLDQRLDEVCAITWCLAKR
ncbi:MAG: four helix bundle protein, partial [Myxococcales bacterium]|nr:four helix bundle protein [Myxococcales bacterium]